MLQDFDSLVRGTLESTLCWQIDDGSWQQAQLSTAAGGLGLRNANTNAPAAFLASSTCSRELCQKINPNYAWDGCGLDAAAGQYSSRVPAYRWVAVD